MATTKKSTAKKRKPAAKKPTKAQLQAKRELNAIILFVLGVLLLLLAAIGVLNTDNRGSFIDLRGLLAMLIAGFALLCALAAGAAWLLHWLRHRK